MLFYIRYEQRFNWVSKMTSQDSKYPLSITLSHSPIRIGVIHGQQCVPTGDIDSLAAIARQMDVDVLVSGGTHKYTTMFLRGTLRGA